jgi:methyl-accepting chemotaxis protein
MKLKFRLTIMIVAMMFVVIAGISMVLLRRATELETASAYEIMKNTTGLYATDLQRRYRVYYDTVKTIAEIMNNYQDLDADLRRLLYNENLRAIITSNPRFVRIYTVWKPGLIDGKDGEYANTPGTDSTGNYITCFSRETGSVTLEAFRGAPRLLGAMSHVPTIGNPVQESIAGRNTYITDITYPILVHDDPNNLAGVVGISLDLSNTQELIQSIKPY